jgi:lipopolysaccharide export system protein LptA
MKWLVCNFFLLLSIGSHHLHAQSNAPAQDTAVTDSVYLQAFQQMQIFQSDTNTRYVLVGDVILSADSNLFFCDSLIFDSDIDSGVIRAYNNIQVTTIEGIVITSDSLIYSLQTSAGRFLGHCTYTENGKQIKSPYISFNTATGEGQFAGGGQLRQGNTRIRSNYGNYSSKGGRSRLTGDVEIRQGPTLIQSKDIIYNSKTGAGKILDSTVIYEEDLTIYCNKGQLGEEGKPSVFGEGTLFVSGSKIGWCNNTRFNPQDSTINLLSDYHIYDTIDSIGMWGVLATLDDKNGSLRGYNRPMVYSISGQDTLFLAADTLFALKDSMGALDSMANPTQLFGWGAAMFFSKNEQGQANSIHWVGATDYLALDGDVVLWNDSTEVLSGAGKMETDSNSRHKRKLSFWGDAFWSRALKPRDLFDQVAGDSIFIILRDTLVQQIEVSNNAKILVFIESETDGLYENGNRSDAAYALVRLDSLGEVFSMLLENGVVGDVFAILNEDGVAQPTMLDAYRSMRHARPSSYVDLTSNPARVPKGPLVLYMRYFNQWAR